MPRTPLTRALHAFADPSTAAAITASGRLAGLADRIEAARPEAAAILRGLADQAALEDTSAGQAIAELIAPDAAPSPALRTTPAQRDQLRAWLSNPDAITAPDGWRTLLTAALDDVDNAPAPDLVPAGLPRPHVALAWRTGAESYVAHLVPPVGFTPTALAACGVLLARDGLKVADTADLEAWGCPTCRRRADAEAA